MKFLILLLLSLSLTGCFHQEITGYEVNLANAYCKDKGGILKIETWHMGDVDVHCNDKYNVSAYTERHYKKSIDQLEKLYLKDIKW